MFGVDPCCCQVRVAPLQHHTVHSNATPQSVFKTLQGSPLGARQTVGIFPVSGAEKAAADDTPRYRTSPASVAETRGVSVIGKNTLAILHLAVENMVPGGSSSYLYNAAIKAEPAIKTT